MLAGDMDASVAVRAVRGIAVVIALGAGTLACGGGDDDEVPLATGDTTTTAETTVPSCRDAHRSVVFVVFGGATSGKDGEAESWVNDPEAGPEARPLAAALAAAYREVGYQIMYVVLLPSETRIGDQPVVDAVTVWLGLNDFPVGEGIQVWAPPGDGSGDASVALIEELTRQGASGVEVDAGYAGDEETVFPLEAGGVPRERLFMLGEEDAATPDVSTPLSAADLPAHVAEVQALDPVCE